MSSSTHVRISRSVYDTISHWAEQAYPHEGCGLLIGRFTADGGKEAVRLAPLENILLKVKAAGSQEAAGRDVRLSTLPPERHNRPEVGFAFDPGEYNRETMKAEREGLDVVGVIHTHPDHPPRPSKIDESQPFLSQWSNIIVAVHRGKINDLKSWFRETDDQPFTEEDVRIAD